jgi:opacity protein-like surface antigen
MLGIAVGTPGAAMAEDDSGIYVDLSGGLNILESTGIDVAGGAATVDNDYDVGYAAYSTFGYDYGRVWKYGGLRSEIEFSYRENDIDTLSIGGVSNPGSRGDVMTYGVMVNGLHDFQTGTAFRPYVGGGIGYAWSKADGIGVPSLTVVDDEGSDFAWQLVMGVGYELTDNATIGVDYRYFDTSANVTTTPAAGQTGNEVDLQSHSFSIGIRYRF